MTNHIHWSIFIIALIGATFLFFGCGDDASSDSDQAPEILSLRLVNSWIGIGKGLSSIHSLESRIQDFEAARRRIDFDDASELNEIDPDDPGSWQENFDYNVYFGDIHIHTNRSACS